MKKIMQKSIIFMFMYVSLFALSGCSGTDDSSAVESEVVTLFLVDEREFAYGGVPYLCDSMDAWDKTSPNGEFTFLPPDNCEFDFLGFEGNYANDPFFDEIVRVVDYKLEGKNEIPYECASFAGSSTYGDGRFDYDSNDACVFYL